MDAKIQLRRLVLSIPLEKLKVYVKHHDEIIDAMKKRDKDLAIALMKHHIMNQLNDQEKVNKR